MLKWVADNLRNGVERLRWFATVFAQRLELEIAVIRLLYRSDEMKKERDRLLLSIGERVYRLRGQRDRHLYKDNEILSAIGRLEEVDKQIDDLKSRADEIGSVRT